MPQQFGRFWLHEKVGHGGMAEIFRASVGPDPAAYKFQIAVKRLHPHLISDRSHVDMFLTEADVTKFLDHPNLLHVYEAGFVGEQPYIAMDYVWGVDLARLLDLLRARGSRFPADLAVYTAMQILRGLDYIHRARAPGGEPMEMIHRDITPANIFATFDGQVKIGDFGVARVSFLEPREESVVLKGKLTHIPPEVVSGDPIGQSDDLWGLSLCLFEMLTGRGIGQFMDAEAIEMGEALPAVPAIRSVNPEIDKRLAKILGRALHPRRKRRPPDAYAYYRLLKAYLRDQGIQVGQEALGRFVRNATGAKDPGAPPIVPMEDDFEQVGYHAPAGPSMTQRMVVGIQIRRRRIWPLAIAVTAVAAVAAWLLLF